MGWPTPQEYNEAIQSPRICFSDPELRLGTPALTALGLPRPISGAFASVYRMDCPGRSWAVRCFLREYADQERRYSEISKQLVAARLPCMVGFEYLPKGILVGGRWYPILKMEWLDGESISEYISHNLNQRQVLQSLSRQWIDLMNSLRQAQIAHGDLQHGNILVSGGKLKLIDYDAMFVPALAGMGSHEEGHRNYQHPGRTGRDYHPDLDNFSAWVIFTSISALAIEPQFWGRLNAGDECLLFRREDFEKPRASKALQTLEKNGNLQLQALVSHFRSILSLPISQIPSLDGSALDQQNEREQKPGQTHRVGPQGLPVWLGDHIDQPIRQTQLEPLGFVAPAATVSSAEWLFDHLVDDNEPSLSRPPVIRRRDRIALWMLVGVLGMMVVAWAFSMLSSFVATAIALLAIIASGSIIVVDFRSSNPVEKRSAIKERISARRKALSEIDQAVNLTKLERARLGEPLVKLKAAYDTLPQSMDAEAGQLDRNLAKTLEGIETRRRRAQKDHDAAIRTLEASAEQLEQDLSTRLGEIETRRLLAKQEEESAIRQLEHRILSNVSRLRQKKGSLASEEKIEIDRVLQQSRSLHVSMALSQARITASVVSGVGEALAERLRTGGVSCASQVTYDRVREVPGIGESKANALISWRRGVEQRANATAPSTLSRTELDRIRASHDAISRTIEQQLASSIEEERKERQQINQRFAVTKRSLDGELESAKRHFDTERDNLRVKNGEERTRLITTLKYLRLSLDDEEGSAKRDHGVRRDEVTAKYTREKDRLTSEYIAKKAKAVEARGKLDETFDRLNQSLFQNRLELRQEEVELSRCREIKFLQYLSLAIRPRLST